MATAHDIMTELNYLTELISKRIRTVSLSVLAFCWALIMQDTMSVSPLLIVPSLGLCLLALCGDIMQYIAGFMLNRQMLSRMEKENIEELSYPTSAPLYVLRKKLFVLKIALTVVGAFWLVGVLCVAVKREIANDNWPQPRAGVAARIQGQYTFGGSEVGNQLRRQ